MENIKRKSLMARLFSKHQWYRKEYGKVSELLGWVCCVCAVAVFVLTLLNLSEDTVIIPIGICSFCLGVVYTLLYVDKHESKRTR